MSQKPRVPSALDDLESWKDHSDDEPVPEWHLKVLEKRLAKPNNNDEGYKPWREFLEELATKN